MTKPPLVEITWTDACDVQSVTARSIEEIKDRVHLRYGRTVRGLLVYQDAEKTIVCHDYDPAGADDDDKRPEMSNFTAMPTGWVTKVRYIERGPRKLKTEVKDGKGAPSKA